ncbi:MAG TPA: tetratricopeptide repeat protein [Tepidisphaeraceae bacterium]
MQYIDAKDFVAAVQPALASQDWGRLMTLLKKRWTPEQIISLLHGDDADARKVAALSIGLIGQACTLPELARRLRDPDRMVIEMAEHAMWQIWFRGGTDEANKHLARGAELLNSQDIEKAICHLNKAIKISPEFPEAYNQRAIAYYMLERYTESIADCEQVVTMMPLHFGAWSGLGHCYLAMNKLPEALKAYEQAIAVNPHLECIVELVDELKHQGDSAA